MPCKCNAPPTITSDEDPVDTLRVLGRKFVCDPLSDLVSRPLVYRAVCLRSDVVMLKRSSGIFEYRLFGNFPPTRSRIRCWRSIRHILGLLVIVRFEIAGHLNV